MHDPAHDGVIVDLEGVLKHIGVPRRLVDEDSALCQADFRQGLDPPIAVNARWKKRFLFSSVVVCCSLRTLMLLNHFSRLWRGSLEQGSQCRCVPR